MLVFGALWSPAHAQVYVGNGMTLSIEDGTTFVAYDGLYIATGATVVVDGTATIVVEGEWTNFGSFDAGNSTVVVTGASSVLLRGQTDFNNVALSLTAGSDLIVDGDATVNGSLSWTSGDIAYRNNARRTLTFINDLEIPGAAECTVELGGAALEHRLRVEGNIVNDGSLNLLPGGNGLVNMWFTGTTTASLSGVGTHSLNHVYVAKGSTAATVTFGPQNLTVPASGFLVVESGMFEFSGSGVFSNPFFTTASYTIPEFGGFYLNSSQATVAGQNGDATIVGQLRIDAGQYEVGTNGGGNENNLLYGSGSELIFSGGTLRIAGRLSRDGNDFSTVNYIQHGGTVVVGAEAFNTSGGARAMFDIGAVASSFTWTGGTISLRRNVSGSNGYLEYEVAATTYYVTGGLLEIDNEGSNDDRFDIETLPQVGEVILQDNTFRARIYNRREPLRVLGDITLQGSGQNRLRCVNDPVEIGGDWINNGNNVNTFNPNGYSVTFNGAGTQSVSGSNPTTFAEMIVNKPGDDTLRLEVEAVADGNVRLLSNTVVDIQQYDFTIGEGSTIYSDAGTAKVFSRRKCIFSREDLNGGYLVRNIAAGASLPQNILFPLGTPGVYTPAEIEFLSGKVTFNAGSYVQVRAVATEHPEVELPNISLRKYWQVTTGNIDIQEEGVNVVFTYNAAEVSGNEGSYEVLHYRPSYPNPNGYWQVNPGVVDNVVDFNSRIFYSQEIDSLNGDWTTGEEDAAKAFYFSRADGDYNDPSTWSRVNFGGVASTVAPNKQSDVVRIQGHEIEITSDIAPANLISVEVDGALRFLGDFVATGDTLRVEEDAILGIGHVDGVADNDNSGNIQTAVRDLASEAVYEYIGTTTSQISGDGLPTSVRALVVYKDVDDTLVMTSSVNIRDSLVIEEGTLDMASYTLNGSSSGRSLVMRNGEFIIRSSFPQNYSSPTFTSGTVTFTGTSSVSIPSSGSTPAVNQYNTLNIRGTRSGGVTFRPLGEIRILNALRLDELEFTGAPTQRFFTDGSTVRYVGTSPTQDIVFQPAAPNDSLVNLQYYNLIVDGSGTKQLTATSANTMVVLNNFSIQTSATLDVQGIDLEVDGNWYNNGGVFDPETQTVILRSQVPTQYEYLYSGPSVNNPFYNLVIAGEGIVQPEDDLVINGTLYIETTANLYVTDANITLVGDWRNSGGSFEPGTAEVDFAGSSEQVLYKVSGTETFYNLTVSNGVRINATQAGIGLDEGITVENVLSLANGSLNVRGHHVRVEGSIDRTGASPGFVDGELRKFVAGGAPTPLFEVGYGNSYTPVTLAFVGTGGTGGYLAVLSDTVTATSTPLSEGVLPAGSGLNDTKHVRRQWDVNIPTGSAFALGGNRYYDITLAFLDNAPDFDIRNGGDTDLFGVRLWNGAEWILPDRTNGPFVKTRSGTSTEYSEVREFGTFTLGEPAFIEFFSIVDGGNWSDPTSWSIQEYGGVPTVVAPTTNANVYIGDGKTIVLDTDHEVGIQGTVIVDSSGVLMLDVNTIYGDGGFEVTSHATVGVANVGGIRSAANSGNILTASRNYDVDNTRLGHFIYYGSEAGQITGDGLPAAVSTLRFTKTANDVTLDNAVTVDSTTWLDNGQLRLGADLTLNGDLRVVSTATFTPLTSTVEFTGTTRQSVSVTGSTLQFNNLTLNKYPITSGNVVIDENSNVEVSNTLQFAALNVSVLDVSSFTNAYVSALGSVTRTGSGHVFGELRKVVGTGSSTVEFEVGDSVQYTPFEFELTGSGGTSGQLAMNAIPMAHPKVDENSPIAPTRKVDRYWRLTRPAGSSWDRGTRDMTVTVNFINPDDVGTVDADACMDMAYYMGDTEEWQPLHLDIGTYGTTNYPVGFGCGDTRIVNGDLQYGGSSTSVIVYDIPIDTALGSTFTAGTSLLLGDFIVGNQNSIEFTSYFTRQDGPWTDPNTWSTDSYGGPAASAYPTTQYELAFIGDGYEVDMVSNIGTAYLWISGSPENASYGPGTIVKNGGRLNLNSFVLRGIATTVEKNATIEVGSSDGIVQQGTGRGNVMTYSRTYTDTMNVVYTGTGETPDFGGSLRYCQPRWFTGSGSIDRVRVRENSSTVIFDHDTGGPFGSRGYHYFADSVIYLTAGTSYDFLLTPTSGGNKRWKVWFDFDYDGSFENNATENVINGRTGGTYNTPSFTVPSGTQPGVIQMRVQMQNNNNSGLSACASNQSGEVEDYTVVIINTSPQLSQVAGNGLPDAVGFIEVNSTRASATSLTLSDDLGVRDSLVVTRGEMIIGNNTIELKGDVVNNATTGELNTNNSEFEFVGEDDQYIRGTASTLFDDVSLVKDEGTVFVSTPAEIDGQLTFNQDNILFVEDNVDLGFTQNSPAISGGSGAFSNVRMIEVSGSTTAGIVRKEFSSSGGSKTFLYPLGVDTVYSEADITFTGSYAGNPSVSVSVSDEKHPNRQKEEILARYWSITSANISSISSSSYDFTYSDSDINGVTTAYVPAYYDPILEEWEINAGVSPKAVPSPIEITDALFIDGDWTAGEKLTFFDGRIFYSRQAGDWNDPNSWSNQGFSGEPASYYPNRLYDKDTVLIDGYTINLNLDTARVDSLLIGGPNNGVSVAGRGILEFGPSPLGKRLFVGRSFHVEEDGRVEGDATNGRRDTIDIEGDILNEALASNSAGIFLSNTANAFSIFRIAGSGSSNIYGNGVWGAAPGIVLTKENGLADSLINNSTTFSGATGVLNPFTFEIYGGILVQNTSASIALNYGSVPDLEIGVGSGVIVQDGEARSSSSVVSNFNTILKVDGGDLVVGDDVDEHIKYKSGTNIEALSGFIDIAGTFSRNASGSLLDFTMNTNATIRVMRLGNTDNNRIAFDVSQAGSSFSMSGGRIIIRDGTSGAASDFSVNAASGTGMVSGTVQSGDSASAAISPVKLAGNIPVYNVHSVGNGQLTYITEESFTIANDLTVDDGHSFQLRGNTLYSGGDITNYGSVNATTGSISTDARQIIFNGSGQQDLFAEDIGGFDLYNVRLNKSTGSVVLIGGGNSNLIVRNTLEFASTNFGLIDARTGNAYVELSPYETSDPDVIRNGYGHVDGRMYRYIEVGVTETEFAVGTSSAVSGYTPVLFETLGSGGTAGLVGVMSNYGNHPQITSASVSSATNVQRYWNVTTNGFALGVDRTFRLTTQFVNPDDLRNSPNFAFFQHHLYTPACPDPPAACPPGTGNWFDFPPFAYTDSSFTSEDHTEYGDFMVAELEGINFYSIASGPWDDANTWSLGGYAGPVAPRAPSFDIDNVFIGNGRRVTVPSTIAQYPTVRSVLVEVYNGNPGELYIEGNLGYVRGTSFVLEDSCSLGIQRLDGLDPDELDGAIQTNTRSFGVSRYEFYNDQGNQITGRLLPDSVMTIIVNNTSPTANKTLFVTNFAGANDISVQDSVIVSSGIMSSGNRDFVLYGDMIMSGTGEFKPLTSQFTYTGTTTHTLRLDNEVGVDYYDLILSGGDVVVTTATPGASTANLYVYSDDDPLNATLTFSTMAVISVRDADRKVVISTGATVTRSASAGHVDGIMQKQIGAGTEYWEYEVGYRQDYTPAYLTYNVTATSGTAGPVDVISYSPVPLSPYTGNRMDPNAKVDYYWSVYAAGTFDLGTRTLHTRFGFPNSEISNLSTSASVMRRRSVPTEFPEWSDKRDLTWSTTAAWAQLAPTEVEWPGLGDFYIGEKAQRIFYSRQSGLWNESSTWSFIDHNGAQVPAGEFPNPDWNIPGGEYEYRDSVIIGGNDVVTLNTLPEIAYLEVSSTGTLVVSSATYISESRLGLSALLTEDDALIDIETAEGIELGTTSGTFRFTDTQRSWAGLTDFEFSGSTNQQFGGGFPLLVGDVTLNNDIASREVNVNRTGVVIQQDLAINTGTLLLDNEDASGAASAQELSVVGDVRIEAGGTFSVSTTGTTGLAHSVVLSGDVVVNDGSWLMRPNGNSADYASTVEFNSSTTQTISGSGTIQLYGVDLNKGSSTASVVAQTDVNISNVTSGNALTFTNGIWEQNAGQLTFDGGVSTSFNQTITTNGSIHVTGTGDLLTGQNGTFGASMVLDGGELLVNTLGQVTIGSVSGNSLQYGVGTQSRFTVESGTVNIAGRISRESATSNRALQYDQSGGTVIVGTVGHDNATLSTFDLGTGGSSFNMSGGTLVLRNANSSTSATRPADFSVSTASVNVTAGTVQFGDGLSGSNQVFDYSMLFGSLHNVAVGATDATVHPLTESSDLRITGNLTNDGTFNSCVTRTGSVSTDADFLFQGQTQDQIVSGLGNTSFWELSMDRQGGGGVVEAQMDISICNLLDLREGTNPNDQILALGTSANITVLNDAPASVVDGTSTGVYRYVRTSVESGRLIRTVTNSGTYDYPIGSYDNGSDQYAPATFVAEASGTNGTVGVRTSPGQGAGGGHLQLAASATDYTNRYWSIDDVTTTIPGQWQFNYLDGAGQITGNEANFASIGRYRPIEEAAGGTWLTIDGTITQASNTFETFGGLAAADFSGDWITANFEAFRRLFYSRQTGDWTDPNSWTFNSSHVGPIAGAGLWPNNSQDSVVIGGGNAGFSNHIISLDQDVAVAGVALGTGLLNTGTLNTQYFAVSGQVFNMSTMSTLQIGSDRGIELAPTTFGNITTTYRIFSTEGNYTYNGTTNQVVGTGLPATLATLTISNTGQSRGTNVVTMLFDVSVRDNLIVTRGTLDMVTYTATSATGTGQFVLQDGAWLKIGGSNNLDISASGYVSSFLGIASTVEFYGGSQTIAVAPNGGVGYGNVIVRNPGVKQVLVPVIIRGDCSIFDNAELFNDSTVDALHVYGDLNLDASTLNNEGKVIIGN